MLEIDPIFKKQMTAMSEKAAQKNIYVFSDFLTLNEQSAFSAMGIRNAQFFGGCEICERKMARFGDPEDLGYEEDYPIVCLRIMARNVHYAEEFSHRDFLGAIMNLGIKRSVVGDIFLLNNVGYVFCTPPMADYIASSLEKIKHTFVKCETVETIPEELKSCTEVTRVNVASERIDAVIAAIYKLSRGESLKCFAAQKVFINDCLCENSSRILKENDRVTLRGFGKFIYRGIRAESKKGRYFIEAEIYTN